jgi:hypothetical protein
MKNELYNNFNWYNAIVNGIYSEEFTKSKFLKYHTELQKEIRHDSRFFNFIRYDNGINYVMYCGARIQRIRSLLKPIFSPYKIVKDESIDGMVTYNYESNKYPQGAFIIFLDSLCTDSTIVHESTHLTDAILKYLNILNGFDRYKYREFTADLCTSIFESAIHFREYRKMDFYCNDLVDMEWKGQRNGFDKRISNTDVVNTFRLNYKTTNNLQDNSISL